VTPPYAIADGIAALKLVRTRAAQWHVDPARVGMIGLSAGARSTLALRSMRRLPVARLFRCCSIRRWKRWPFLRTHRPHLSPWHGRSPSGRAGYGLIES